MVFNACNRRSRRGRDVQRCAGPRIRQGSRTVPWRDPVAGRDKCDGDGHADQARDRDHRREPHVRQRVRAPISRRRARRCCNLLSEGIVTAVGRPGPERRQGAEQDRLPTPRPYQIDPQARARTRRSRSPTRPTCPRRAAARTATCPTPASRRICPTRRTRSRSTSRTSTITASTAVRHLRVQRRVRRRPAPPLLPDVPGGLARQRTISGPGCTRLPATPTAPRRRARSPTSPPTRAPSTWASTTWRRATPRRSTSSLSTMRCPTTTTRR